MRYVVVDRESYFSVYTIFGDETVVQRDEYLCILRNHDVIHRIHGSSAGEFDTPEKARRTMNQLTHLAEIHNS